jgi:hypothetical protein
MLNVKTFLLFLGVTFLTFSPPVQSAIDHIDGGVPKLSALKNMSKHPDGLQEESKKATDIKSSPDDLVASTSDLSVSDSPKPAPLSRPPEFSGGTCFPKNRYNRPPEAVDGAKPTLRKWGKKGNMTRSKTDRGLSVPATVTASGDPRHLDRNY